MKDETKKELTRLKGEYSGNPFDEDNRVMMEFLEFVVEHYQEDRNKIVEIIESKQD